MDGGTRLMLGSVRPAIGPVQEPSLASSPVTAIPAMQFLLTRLLDSNATSARTRLTDTGVNQG
jgi:hypothetical protein